MQNTPPIPPDISGVPPAVPTRVSLRLSDLRPFVEPLLNLSPNRHRDSLFSTPTTAAVAATAVRSLSLTDDSYIIDIPSLDRSNIVAGTSNATHNAILADNTSPINSSQEHDDDQSLNNNNNEVTDDLTNNPNTVQIETVVDFIETLCKIIRQYAIWFLLFAIKFCFDHSRIFCYLLVQLTYFLHLDRHVKSENNRLTPSRHLLLLIIENIGSFFIIFVLQEFFFSHTNNYYMIFMIPDPDLVPKEFWDIVWTTAIVDMNLKLLTIFLKSVLIVLLPINSRSKFFVFIESVSQLYRGLIPIRFWTHYLMKPISTNVEYVFSIVLTSCYLVLKMHFLVAKLKFVWRSIPKLFQKSHIGPKATEEQIKNWSENCPICFGSYNCPIILTCKHIFCEECIQTWLDRMHSCPVCRVKIVDDPDWRNGRTTQVIELF